MDNKPIILIDDDTEDLEILQQVAIEMGLANPVISFTDATRALAFFKENHVNALFILCDMNMPRIDGLELREEMIRYDGYMDSIPFFLMSTVANRAAELPVSLNVRGVFTKPSSYIGVREVLELIVSKAVAKAVPRKNIVIIDDDKEDLDLIRDIIYEIAPDTSLTCFADPEKALVHLSATTEIPAIIICDINMPKMDGFKLRSSLLKLSGPIKDVPFFILTTARMNWELLLADKLKIRSCCTKEASLEGMKNTIQSILESAEEL